MALTSDRRHEQGIILDIECSPGSITGHNLSIVRDGFTELTCALQRKMKALVPGSVLSWAMPLTAVDKADGGIYDFAAMQAGNCIDYFVPMAYQQQCVANPFSFHHSMASSGFRHRVV